MGGLRKELPVTFWTFLAGGCALAGLPFVTAGFFSKDLIIWQAWSAQGGHPAFWLAGMLGAGLTSLYTFRLIFRVFFGPLGMSVTKRPGYAMKVPLIILAVFAVVGGYLKEPLFAFLHWPYRNDRSARRRFDGDGLGDGCRNLVFRWTVFCVCVPPEKTEPCGFASSKPGWPRSRPMVVCRLGLRLIYDKVFVQPFIWVANVNKSDFVDAFYTEWAHSGGIVLLAERHRNRSCALVRHGHGGGISAVYSIGAV